MNKGLGATFGAMLLAGFLFQARPGSSPSSSQGTTSAQSTTKPVTGEGPWLASCKYWSASQSQSEPAAKDTSPDVDLTLHLSGKDVDSHIKAIPPPESPCGAGDGWGIPDASHPEISAIVATIPDPVHSHFALDFDRSIDAILLAAADNGYLSSYYWLPWRSRSASLSSSESAASPAPKDEDNTRERQPGLIILRYSPNDWPASAETDDSDTQKTTLSRAAYHRVIYLFLVAETPVLGVNGTQLQNAFKYEMILKRDHSALLSVRPPPLPQEDKAKDKKANAPTDTTTPPDPLARAKTTLSVIGPFFSGSAASLHQGIEAALRDLKSTLNESLQPSITGVTSTLVAVHELDPANKNIYRSFGENAGFEQERFLKSLGATGYDLSRVAVLSEAGTVFGSATKVDSNSPFNRDISKQGTILNLRFPRELSLLRNAQSGSSATTEASSAPPTPYLNLSLKDYSADDTVPRFSTGQSPLSIEAQLMAISHQLQRARTQFILLSASNILDDIFLANFLHRTCPDARLVLFAGGDLLFERDVDNQPYIGSISISPYLLTSLDFGNKVQWLHSDYQAESIYNATSYTFWDHATGTAPKLDGYRRYPVPDPDPDSAPPVTQFMQIPLWATAIGADGYYPLGILDWCASDRPQILPTIQPASSGFPLTEDRKEEEKCNEKKKSVAVTITTNKNGVQGTKILPEQHLWDYIPESINRNSGISPSLAWMLLDIFVLVVCILHIVFMWGAQFWSPATRDLAVDQNDQPHRRSVYLNIGTSVLAALAFVTAYPLILVGHYYHLAFAGHLFAWLTLIAAVLASLSTAIKTWPYRNSRRCPEYRFFNIVAVLSLFFTVAFWVAICRSDNLGGEHTYAGLYFSYRCLQPLSGVCPLLPIVMLLLAWYLWAMCQTARLRFSDVHRPRIARSVSPTPDAPPYSPSNAPYPLYVPDDALEHCARPIDSCLYSNMACLLITREVILRFCGNLKHDSRKAVAFLAAWVKSHINPVLAGVYLFLFALCIFASHIRSLDRFLFTPILNSLHIETHYGPTLYEFLITALFFPLIMVALSGWLRTILIWGALSRGLLEPLERFPIRFAFTRIKGGSWVSMLNQSGLPIRWRDMSRATEAIRQLVHHPYVKAKPALEAELLPHYYAINSYIRKLMLSIKVAGTQMPDALAAAAREAAAAEGQPAVACLVDAWDRPKPPADDDLCCIYSIEENYASFSTSLLNSVLVPHWDQVRTGLVEDCNIPFKDEAKAEESKEPEEAPKLPGPGEVAQAAESAEAGKIQQAAAVEQPEKPTECDPGFLHLAEELIVIRYIALIRAVLVNMRYLMLFVSTAFVLALVAWNSYPFQPHRLVDWCFTVMLIIIGTGIVWIFAQMHRNPLLSRITDTTPNKLGVDFFIRIATFGAVPVLTWLAYQFPEIGGSLFKIFQPGLQVLK